MIRTAHRRRAGRQQGAHGDTRHELCEFVARQRIVLSVPLKTAGNHHRDGARGDPGVHNLKLTRLDPRLDQPADAIVATQGGDNGTPTQKDEPTAENPPNGAAIDYYLKTTATGTVTLEIQDAAGATLATFSNGAAAGPAEIGRAHV